jgi:hypothetical protein
LCHTSSVARNGSMDLLLLVHYNFEPVFRVLPAPKSPHNTRTKVFQYLIYGKHAAFL